MHPFRVLIPLVTYGQKGHTPQQGRWKPELSLGSVQEVGLMVRYISFLSPSEALVVEGFAMIVKPRCHDSWAPGVRSSARILM